MDFIAGFIKGDAVDNPPALKLLHQVLGYQADFLDPRGLCGMSAVQELRPLIARYLSDVMILTGPVSPESTSSVPRSRR